MHCVLLLLSSWDDHDSHCSLKPSWMSNLFSCSWSGYISVTGHLRHSEATLGFTRLTPRCLPQHHSGWSSNQTLAFFSPYLILNIIIIIIHPFLCGSSIVWRENLRNDDVGSYMSITGHRMLVHRMAQCDTATTRCTHTLYVSEMLTLCCLKKQPKSSESCDYHK